MPKSKDIAKYIRENNIDAKSLILMLEKYKAIAMLPSILKVLKNLELQVNPVPVIELPHENTDTELIANISLAHKIKKGNINFNKNILGGFRVIKDYKLYDYSISGYLNRLLG